MITRELSLAAPRAEVEDLVAAEGEEERHRGAAEVRHVIPWSEGGLTDVDNGVILCRYDHRKMHAREWRIEMVDPKPVSIPPEWMKRNPTSTDPTGRRQGLDGEPEAAVKLSPW